MVYSLAYRRPASSKGSVLSDMPSTYDPSVESGSTGSVSRGIPEALSFNRIMDGATCPPCTVREFMNYLKYIEHDAENLQFYLWHKDYVERFAKLPDSEKCLSPEWTAEQAQADNSAYRAQVNSKKTAADPAAVIKAFENEKEKEIVADKASKSSDERNPFNESRESTVADQDSPPTETMSLSNHSQTTKSAYSQRAEAAFEEAGLKWKPFTIQPFREEMARIITIYIADGAPRQLNLSSKDRASVLHALAITTHPSAFRNIIATVEWTLRRQSHPNFIRWTVCNGNRPRVIFARGLGVSGILGGIICGILLCLSSAGRGWRVMALIPFMIGISTLIAAWRGMCVVLHGMHHRHLRPWELFEGDDIDDEMTKERDSLDTIGSSSYEDEPWVAKYQKRNLIRKIFDREVWIQEPALRQIQDTIFLQAVLGATVSSFIFVGIFCAVPHGNLF